MLFKRTISNCLFDFKKPTKFNFYRQFFKLKDINKIICEFTSFSLLKIDFFEIFKFNTNRKVLYLFHFQKNKLKTIPNEDFKRF
ncbi:hypothetical protein BIW12_06915 [Flavobacterium commune]|uniref:Uncharacterized protein n=1 Tax=Flavobacterium commune TaxID=1306519 RepID=A0A1D9PAT5_9FLAO|nr:hypothetical protein BIW12_06915 [Flavobacterium commune]